MENFDEKSPMDNFQLKPYLFNVLYPNIGSLNFHIWKYLNLIFSENPKA